MNQRVLIIGSSLAGLVAAFRLSLKGYAVTILETHDHEEASWLSLNDHASHMDTPWNHPSDQCSIDPLLLYGTSEYTTALLDELGGEHHTSQFVTVPIEFMTSERQTTSFAPWPLPSPWHTLVELMRFPALSLRQKWHAVNYIEKVWEGAASLPSHLDLQSADSWLTSIGQPQLAQERVWEPLCRFFLGKCLSQTYAATLATTLKHVFLQSPKHYPPTTSTLGIDQLLLTPLRTRIKERGGHFRQITALEHIEVTTDRIVGLRSIDGTVWTADWYLMAIHPKTFMHLLPERLLARYAFFHQLNHVHWIPALQVDFSLPQPVRQPRLILQNGRFSWIFSRSIQTPDACHTVISCVATGDTHFQSQANDALQSLVQQGIKEMLSIMDQQEANSHEAYRIRLHCQEFVPYGTGTMSFQPSNQTPLSNLFIAGAWTDTNALTSIERSTMSGTLCAQVMSQQGHSAALTSSDAIHNMRGL